jgi:serine protease AprX
MFKRIAALAALALGLLVCGIAAAHPPGLTRLGVAPSNALGSYDGVATFSGAMPTQAQLEGLRGLGLQVQSLSHLPLALMRGPRPAMFEAVARGFAADVYPNDRLQFHSNASNLAMRANEVHAAGVDGTGIVVAVIDSGIDASHPDLARRVVHNLKMIESGTAAGDIVVPMEQLPYNNSDTTSGHGTHVAGIIAADNTDGLVKGVAPGASLVGYGTGEAIFVFGAISAFNHMISKRDEWSIRVVNNSWGSSFRLFDPDEPINQATKRAYDAGIVVVFAAGNASTEMAINPYSVAPWVISTGNGTLNHQRNATSSGGLEFDNSVLTTLPAGEEKHLAFAGDRIGLYHPTITAPGTNIVSTGSRTGLAVTTDPDGTATASGTSMASPHVAGVVALMLQKQPALTFEEVKSALQVTSTLMADTADPLRVQAFYTVGYGYADAKAAVDLVGRHRFKRKSLERMQSTVDARVLGDRDWRVLGTDYWTFNAAAATVNGTPDNRTFAVAVPAGTQGLKGVVSYPSLGYVGLNAFNYVLTVTDAAGKLVATSTPASNAGMSKLFVDLTQGTYTYGAWSVNVRGDLGAQDQDVIMGILVSVALHRLEKQARVSPALPAFTPTGSQTFYFTPGAAGLAASPEGCNLQAGAPAGGMAPARPSGACQSASMGYAVNYGAGIPGVFTSAPLPAALTVGGVMALRFYLVDPAQPGWTLAQNPRLVVEVDAVDENGELLIAVGAAEFTVCNGTPRVCNVGPQPVGGTYTMNIPPVSLPAGSRLSVVVRETGVVSSAARTLWGGAGLGGDFSDAGVTLTTGTLQ